MFDNKTTLITGGTGFMGSRLMKRLLATHNPKKVICFSRRWNDQEQLAAKLNDSRARFITGDICDFPAIKSALRGVDYVIHAAAYKSVPSAEYNPFEAVRVNLVGSEYLIRACIENGVKRLLAISSDKACDPLSLYGVTKKGMESVCIAANNMGQTEIVIARYGNVIGSTGSVIPLFRKLAAGGDANLPITDPAMTRFWMTERQAVDFILNGCFPNLKRGEIGVPILKSSTIGDLAEAFMQIYPGNAYVIVGSRPGEKRHELMIADHELRRVDSRDNMLVIRPQFNMWDKDQYDDDPSKILTEEYSSKTAKRYTIDELVNLIGEAG